MRTIKLLLCTAVAYPSPHPKSNRTLRDEELATFDNDSWPVEYGQNGHVAHAAEYVDDHEERWKSGLQHRA